MGFAPDDSSAPATSATYIKEPRACLRFLRGRGDEAAGFGVAPAAKERGGGVPGVGEASVPDLKSTTRHAIVQRMQNNPSDHHEPNLPFFQKGGGWVLAQVVVMGGWLALTPLGHAVARAPGLLVPAVLLLGIGAVVGVAGALVLGRNRTPFPRPRRDSHLVKTGIYALVRHPLYASLIALSFGWACLWGSEPGAMVALVQAILLDAKARHEERWLQKQFPDYADYAAKVRRLIPWVY
jgi:protein-S-isoprenylcysteine O-methyltransferase Ste14